MKNKYEARIIVVMASGRTKERERSVTSKKRETDTERGEIVMSIEK